jgi:DNA-directed RNA polymerase specialized sigma24 family protein
VQFFPRSRRPASEESSDLDAEVVCRLYSPLRRFAAVVASADVEPDDLVQEALERALRLRPLRDLDDPLSYLRRAMLNLASNDRRSSGRRQRALILLSRTAEPSPMSYPSDLTVLGGLAPTTRAVLYLAEVENWTYAEIGAQLGCTEAAARARAARGRRALRSQLEAADE